MRVVKKLILTLVDRYQARGGGETVFRVDCNFEPSCSEYTKQAVTRHGVRRGLGLAWCRLKRCSAPDQVEKTPDPVPGEAG